MKILALILLSSLASGLGQILLHGGAKAITPISQANMWNIALWTSFALNGKIIVGLSLWAFSTALWLVVLNKSELSYAYYVASINYVIIPIVSRWLYDEQLNWTRIMGMALILLGVAVTIYGREAQP